MEKMVYALYKGDEFLDLGTKEELAKVLGVKQQTISFYMSPVHYKISKGNGYVVIRIDEEKNEQKEIVQMLNPKGFYMKVNKATGAILATKKSFGQYKNIPVFSVKGK
jgi:hypothetical protein